jgi:His/Glu/Gln/Arg/opine family amino acid ABC transporter permease subunit
MHFDYHILIGYWPALWQSFLMTLLLSVITLAVSTPLAILIAVARRTGPPWISTPAACFVNVVRVLPVLLILYFVFYGLPQFGPSLTPFEAALFGLIVAGTAYLSEDLRGGFAAVPMGQWQAARALGMPFWLMMRRVILPQAAPAMLPPYMSRAIIIVKSTSIAGLVAVNELTGQTYADISTTYHSIEFLTVAAVLYLIVNGLLALLQEALEGRLRRHRQRR